MRETGKFIPFFEPFKYEETERWNSWVFNIKNNSWYIFNFKSDDYKVGLDEVLKDYTVYASSLNYVPTVYIFKKEKECDETYIIETDKIQPTPLNSMAETKGLSFGSYTTYKKILNIDVEANIDDDILVEIVEDRSTFKRMYAVEQTKYKMLTRFAPKTSIARSFNIKFLFTHIQGIKPVIQAIKIIYKRLPLKYKKI